MKKVFVSLISFLFFSTSLKASLLGTEVREDREINSFKQGIYFSPPKTVSLVQPSYEGVTLQSPLSKETFLSFTHFLKEAQSEEGSFSYREYIWQLLLELQENFWQSLYALIQQTQTTANFTKDIKTPSMVVCNNTLLPSLSNPLSSSQEPLPREQEGLENIEPFFSFSSQETLLREEEREEALFSQGNRENGQENEESIAEQRLPSSSVSFSFNALPFQVMTNIVDYLDYKDHFELAQTSRKQLFLWGSLSRVPDSPVLLKPDSLEKTTFKWAGEWPLRATPSLVIKVTHTINEEELEKLKFLEDIEKVKFLCFEAEQEGVEIHLGELLSSHFSHLLSLTFKKVFPYTLWEWRGIAPLEQLIIEDPILNSSLFVFWLAIASSFLASVLFFPLSN